MKNDEIHNEIIDRGGHGILNSLYKLERREGKIETKILLNNKELINGETKHIDCFMFEMGGHNKETYDGYDLVGVECRLFYYEANSVMFHEIIPKYLEFFLISIYYIHLYLLG